MSIHCNFFMGQWAEGACGEEQHIPSVSQITPPAMTEYLAPPTQLELVSHSIVLPLSLCIQLNQHKMFDLVLLRLGWLVNQFPDYLHYLFDLLLAFGFEYISLLVFVAAKMDSKWKYFAGLRGISVFRSILRRSFSCLWTSCHGMINLFTKTTER